MTERKSNYIALPEHPAIARCYICGKSQPVSDMLNIGNGKFRCKKHKQSTILKAGDNKVMTSGKKWRINLNITGTIEEG